MKEDLFNNFSLSDDEVCVIIKKFEKIISKKSYIFGEHNKDCEQEIRLQIYKALTKNRKK